MTEITRPQRTVHVRITASRSWFDLGLRELWHYKDFARILAIRDIKLRYRQTALGVAGVVLQPILTAVVLTFVFGRVADLPSEGVPYFAFSFAGFLGWNMFAAVLSRASGSLVANAQLVSKIYVPRLLLPVASILVVGVDLAIAAGIMIATMAVYGLAPVAAVIWLPLWLAGIIAIALGVGAAAGAAMAHYRDVGTALATVLQVLMYLTPVAYSSTAVPENLKGLYQLNPLVTFLDGVRWSILGTHAPSAARVATAAVFSVAVLLVGCVFFARVERGLADVI